MFSFLGRPRGVAALCSASAVAIIASVSPAGAQEQLRSYNIPAQQLSSALLEFSRQSDVRVMADPAVVNGRQAPALQGTFTVSQGLDRLLAGSGLTHSLSPSGAILVQAASPTQLGAADPAAEEEIVVTGTRLRGQTVAAQTDSVTREAIERSAVTTTEDIFAQLPQNFAGLNAGTAYGVDGGSLLAGQNVFERVTAIDLRGLGAESTLTLIDGGRMAGALYGQVVDVSVIPVDAIDRVEISMGGNSAIYGGDAVAGVANIITRRSFDGARSTATFASADVGGERYTVGQVFGIDRERLGLIAAYDYKQELPLNLVERGLTSDTPTNFGLIPLSLQVQPQLTQHSGFVGVRFSPASGIDFFADALYALRESEEYTSYYTPPDTPDNPTITQTENSAETYRLSGGASIDLNNWGVDVRLGTSGRDNLSASDSLPFPNPIRVSQDSRLHAGSIVATGPLALLGREIESAFGIELRQETLLARDQLGGVVQADASRRVSSVFGELSLPIIEGADTPILEATLAARFDDYSDFGDTTNPQFGVLFRPLDGLLLRGTYSTAFRAPPLLLYAPTDSIIIFTISDPSAPGGTSDTLFWLGNGPNLQPEEAITESIGFDFRPQFADWLNFSVTYYRIDYENRIAEPFPLGSLFSILDEEALYADAINRNPTAVTANTAVAAGLSTGFFSNFTATPFDPVTESVLDVFPNLVLVDGRTINVATEQLEGWDFGLEGTAEAGSFHLTFGLNGTYIANHERQRLVTSPISSQVNGVGRASDLRLRANVGVERDAFGAFLQINYLDGYPVNLAGSTTSSIDSWTTYDLTLTYDGDNANAADRLRRVSIAFSIANLFDTDPPEFRDNGFGVLFDPSNANGVGRYVSLRVARNW